MANIFTDESESSTFKWLNNVTAGGGVAFICKFKVGLSFHIKNTEVSSFVKLPL